MTPEARAAEWLEEPSAADHYGMAGLGQRWCRACADFRPAEGFTGVRCGECRPSDLQPGNAERARLHAAGYRRCPDTAHGCGRLLPLSAFGAARHRPYGLHMYCQSCANDMRRESRGVHWSVPWATAVDAPRDHYLYRLYDAEGALLYVGITHDVQERLFGGRWKGQSHAESKAWFPEVRRVRVETFSARVHVQDAEARAVLHEDPRHNKTRPTLRLHTPALPLSSTEFQIE